MANSYKLSKNTARATIFGFLTKIVSMVGAFSVKTVLIYQLGIQYVGLDGLFVSILMFLNMAELGFSTAIVYKLYKPIAENNTKEVCALLAFYRKVYRVIGVGVLLLGLLLLPFINNFVDESSVPSELNLYVLYLIYLSNSVLGYLLFAYKTALINAHQRNDIVYNVYSTTTILQYALQIALLFLFRNFYFYVIVFPLITLSNNLALAYISKRKYPQYYCDGEVSDSVKQDIKHRIQALVYNKVGVAIINGSANIVVSKFLGLTILGIYVSYYYIFSILHQFLAVFYESVTPGLGNKMVIDSAETNYIRFKRLYFMNFWLVGLSSICMFCLYDPFIELWIGIDKTQGIAFSALMSCFFYFWMIRFAVIVYKNALGLWWEDRFRPFTEGIVNIILSLILVNFMGLYGVILSSVVAMILVSIPWETSVLFRHYFKKSKQPYYTTFFLSVVIIMSVGVITYMLVSQIKGSGLLLFVLKTFVSLLVVNTLFCAIFSRLNEFKYYQEKILHLINHC